MASVFVLSFGCAAAYGASVDRTQGAAQAVFEAGFTGGATLYTHNPAANGVPIQIVPTGDPESVRIYQGLKNASYCGSGWHVVDVDYGDGVAAFGSRQALFAYLALVQIRFSLDNVELVTSRTSIKSFPASLAAFGIEDGYWFGVGTLLPPGTLAVGKHKFEMEIVDPLYPTVRLTSHFTVLPC